MPRNPAFSRDAVLPDGRPNAGPAVLRTLEAQRRCSRWSQARFIPTNGRASEAQHKSRSDRSPRRVPVRQDSFQACQARANQSILSSSHQSFTPASPAPSLDPTLAASAAPSPVPSAPEDAPAAYKAAPSARRPQPSSSSAALAGRRGPPRLQHLRQPQPPHKKLQCSCFQPKSARAYWHITTATLMHAGTVDIHRIRIWSRPPST
jgi:hypothetical protein